MLDDDDVGVDEPTKSLAWIRKSYFQEIFNFLVNKFIETKAVPHRFVDGIFQPFFTPKNMSNGDDQDVAVKAKAAMLEEDLAEVNEQLIQEWTLIQRVSRSKTKIEWLDLAITFFEVTIWCLAPPIKNITL